MKTNIYRVVLKHLAGQHNQKRHGWRYGKNNRGPLFSDVEDRAIFDERLSTRFRVTEQELKEAKAIISGAQNQYILEKSKNREANDLAKNAIRQVRVEEAELDSLWEKWKSSGKILEDKRTELSDKREELRKQRDALGEEKRFTSKYKALDKKVWALSSKIRDIDEKLYSDKKLVDLDMKIREQREIVNRAKNSAFYAVSRARNSDVEEAAISKYLYATEDARRIVQRYYTAEADKIRRAAIVKSDRYTRLSNYYTEKASKLSNQYYKESEEYDAKQSRWGEFGKTERGKQLLAQRAGLYQKHERYKELAKSVFGNSLLQSSPANTRNIKTSDVLSGDTLEQNQIGINAFASLVGKNKLFSSETIHVVSMGKTEYARAGYSEGVLQTPRVPTIDGRKRKDRIYSNTERDVQEAKLSLVNSTVHELGHALEQFDPGIRAMVIGFYKRRTQDSDQTTMYGNLKFGNFDFSEYTKPDKFVDKYIGKTYGKEGRTWGNEMFATEVLSMGIEYMWKDPLGLAKDADMFNFIYSVLRMNE